MTLAYVVSLNLKRRHLSESQRALIAAEIAGVYAGRPRKDGISSTLAPTHKEAAELLNVHPKMVQAAVAVKNKGVPELKKAVQSEEIRLNPAAKIARLPKPEQRAAS